MRLFLAICALMAAIGARADIIDINSAELARLRAAGVPVIDIRTAPEWEETGILPGSHLITYFDEQGKADPPAWLAKVKALAGPADPVVVICRSGNRTKAASRFLAQEAGYARVYNAKDGIRAWIKEGRPTVSAAPTLAACRAARSC